MQPTAYRWRAPTQFTDGVPITVPLNYEIGRDDDQDGPGDFVPLYTVVGSLIPAASPEMYEAPVGSLVFDPGIHRLAIRALNPGVSPITTSEWSNYDEFTVSNDVPETPLDFSVVF